MLCIKEAASTSITVHSCAFFPPGTPDWPLQNQLAKSHFTKVAGVLLSTARPLRCHSVGLKVRAVSLGLNCVGLVQTKSHRYPGTPVQLAPQGPLIGRDFGPNGGCSELNLPTLRPHCRYPFPPYPAAETVLNLDIIAEPSCNKDFHLCSPLPSPGDQSFTCVIRNGCQNRNCTLARGPCVQRADIRLGKWWVNRVREKETEKRGEK